MLLLLGAPLFIRAEKGFTPVFDGKSLDGWTLVGKKGPGYLVEKGRVVCPADGGGNIFAPKEYSNFVLRLEYRLAEGGNNGVGIRAPIEGRISRVGMEIQILDDEAKVYKGRLSPAQYNGSVYGVLPCRRGYLKRPWKWNRMEITANGPRITVNLNGVVIVDGDLSRVREPKVLEAHPGIRRTGGRIGFLGHSTRVEFRNVRIKELL